MIQHEVGSRNRSHYLGKRTNSNDRVNNRVDIRVVIGIDILG